VRGGRGGEGREGGGRAGEGDEEITLATSTKSWMVWTQCSDFRS
jgi:hypothetical protein